MNLIFLGPPGSGKGTQSLMLEKLLNVPKVSTGEILRKAVDDQTEIGLKIGSIIESGAFVSDDIVIDMLSQKLNNSDCSNGFILDGFPRTIEQAKALDVLLAKINKKIDAVLELKVDEQVLIDRISGRFSCADCGAAYNEKSNSPKVAGICDQCGSKNFICRKDDNVETVANRLKIYRDQTSKLLPYYKDKGILYSVDGVADIKIVSEQIKLIVQSVSNILT
jgi:adenylate kinase